MTPLDLTATLRWVRGTAAREIDDMMYAQVAYHAIPPARFPTVESLERFALPHQPSYRGESLEPTLLRALATNYAAGDRAVLKRRRLTGAALREDRSCFWEMGHRMLLPEGMFGLFELAQFDLADQARIAISMREGFNLLGVTPEQSRSTRMIDDVAHAIAAQGETHGTHWPSVGPNFWALIFLMTLLGLSRTASTFVPGAAPLFLSPEHTLITSLLELRTGDSFTGKYYEVDVLTRLLRAFSPAELDLALQQHRGWLWENITQLADVGYRFPHEGLSQQVQLAAMPAAVYNTLLADL